MHANNPARSAQSRALDVFFAPSVILDETEDPTGHFADLQSAKRPIAPDRSSPTSALSARLGVGLDQLDQPIERRLHLCLYGRQFGRAADGCVPEKIKFHLWFRAAASRCERVAIR